MCCYTQKVQVVVESPHVIVALGLGTEAVDQIFMLLLGEISLRVGRPLLSYGGLGIS